MGMTDQQVRQLLENHLNRAYDPGLGDMVEPAWQCMEMAYRGEWESEIETPRGTYRVNRLFDDLQLGYYYGLLHPEFDETQ